MAARDALISDWQERLKADEAQVSTAAPRLAWLFRARARIYRLLLAMYGEGDWRADCEAPAPIADDAALSQSVASSSISASGKPPKAVAEIRKRLKSVRAAAMATAGDADSPTTSYLDQRSRELTSILHCLSAEQMRNGKAALRRSRIRYEVCGSHLFVHEDDRQAALEALAADRQARQNEHAARLRQSNCSARLGLVMLVLLLLGSVVGFAILPLLFR